jgi:ZIP family zinc transporter
MPDWLVVFLAGSATALACGFGVFPVTLLGPRIADYRPLLWGLAAGLMTVAAILGLIVPGLRYGSLVQVWGGVAVGVVFLLAARRATERRDFRIGELRGASARRIALIFSVLLLHSLPEGFAIGTAYGSGETDLGVYVILAIALQNIPEGTSVAIPMQESGFSTKTQFWAAVATSAPQPVGALVAFLLVEQITSLLPTSFGFAAGAMLALVAVELVPVAFRRGSWRSASAGALAGAALMALLSIALGV